MGKTYAAIGIKRIASSDAATCGRVPQKQLKGFFQRQAFPLRQAASWACPPAVKSCWVRFISAYPLRASVNIDVVAAHKAQQGNAVGLGHFHRCERGCARSYEQLDPAGHNDFESMSEASLPLKMSIFPFGSRPCSNMAPMTLSSALWRAISS